MTDLKWMLSSDQQIPYQDDRMIKLWFDVMRWFKPDVIDYAGDQSDQMCWSRWTDDTSKEFLKQLEEREAIPFALEQEKDVKAFYTQTRKLAKNAEIFVALGNHDIRYEGYFDKKMPEVLEALTPESMWGFESLGIDYIHYNEPPKHRYGDLFVHHGVSISKHAGESVKNDIGDFGISLIRGHSHRLGSYFRTFPLREYGKTNRGYELGHMMDIKHPEVNYQNVFNWQKGFAVGYISDGSTDNLDGKNVHIQLIEVNEDYECWIAGKLFKG